jgi:gas vesicle protein
MEAEMRALFGIYLGGIIGTIAYFVVIGLTHH